MSLLSFHMNSFISSLTSSYLPPLSYNHPSRRLSVVSDNKLIEGISSIGAVDSDKSNRKIRAEDECVIRSYAGVSKKGYAPYNPRKRNQDAILMEEDKEHSTLIFGVFDGHGEAGDLVSHYFTERIAQRLEKNVKYSADPGAAMKEELEKIERSLLSDASIDTEFSGSTGVIGTVRGHTLTVANIGDSRVILGRIEKSAVVSGSTTSTISVGSVASSSSLSSSSSSSAFTSIRSTGVKGSSVIGAGSALSSTEKSEALSHHGAAIAVEVSIDHKPDHPVEKERILKSGGRVFSVEYDDGVDGPPRVWLAHMEIPGLAMSRSLGDTVAHTAGVISAPEIFSVTLTPEDRVLVWASDGLWEFMSNQEVLNLIANINDPKLAVDVLIEEANARWMKEEQVIDDTTVIVCFLDVKKR